MVFWGLIAQRADIPIESYPTSIKMSILPVSLAWNMYAKPVAKIRFNFAYFSSEYLVDQFCPQFGKIVCFLMIMTCANYKCQLFCLQDDLHMWIPCQQPTEGDQIWWGGIKVPCASKQANYLSSFPQGGFTAGSSLRVYRLSRNFPASKDTTDAVPALQHLWVFFSS